MSDTEKKLSRTATKKRIAEYRTSAPGITDEALLKVVVEVYPDKFTEPMEVGYEVVKECYREELPLTEESLKEQLQKLYEGRWLRKYDKEYQKGIELNKRKDILVEQIYKDAQRRTCYLSNYPDADDELLAFIDKIYPDKNRAQTFYRLFCKYIFNGYPPFHSYTEPNGDIIFTKRRRSADDYDSNGVYKGGQSSKSGCMLWLMLIPLASILLYLYV